MLNMLLSYHYVKNWNLDERFAQYFVQPYPNLFLDSGAYSAATQNVHIDINAYARFIKKYQHLIATYANLDVIGNAQATWDNQQHLESLGLHPIPVFHVGESWEYLERYIDRYPYIALGGMVGYHSPKLLFPWIIKCFKLAVGKSVYHGFGCTGWSTVKMFPWYSVDSSAWGAGYRYGQLTLFSAQRLTCAFVRVQLGDTANYTHAQLIRSYGFNPADFAIRSQNTGQNIAVICAHSYMRAEQWLRTYHGRVAYPDTTQRDAGIHLYLADSNMASFNGIQQHIAQQTVI